MGETEQRLSELLPNDESRQKIAQLASLLGGGGTTANTQSAAQDASPKADNNISALAAALPALLQALSGNGELLDEKRIKLMRALEPYLSEKRTGSIERAIKMANIAKAAKDTLGALGR